MGDQLIVNGLAAATVTVNHTGPNAGTIIGAETSTITYGTIEALFVHAQTSTTLAVTGSPDYTVNPGDETDQGEILSTGVPLTFDGYGAGENINLTGTGGGTVIVNGTPANDAFGVSAGNAITIAGRATVNPATLPNAVLNGYEGDDTFTVIGNTFTLLNINGGDGDDDDSLALSGPTGAVTVNLGTRAISGYTAAGGFVNYTGLQSISTDTNQQAINFVLGAGDDDVRVVVLNRNSGVVHANNTDPVVTYSNTNGNAAIFDLGGGEDTLNVVGSTFGTRPNNQPQVFTADVPNRFVTIDDQNDATHDGRIEWVVGGTETLGLFGLEGDDTFNVTTGNIPVFVDGGDPIGQTAGDQLNIIADPMNPQMVTFEPGPEDDEGGFVVGTNGRVSFDHIEALSKSPTLPVHSSSERTMTMTSRSLLVPPKRCRRNLSEPTACGTSQLR